jgi:predicted O-methyltransferase YrrM
VKVTPADLERIRKQALACQNLDVPYLNDLFNLDPTCIYYRFIYLLVHEFKLADCVELGTHLGRCAAHMAAANPRGHVWAVDPTPQPGYPETTASFPNITLLQTRSDDLAALERVPNGSVALCFVDSLHDPDYTLTEVRLWTPKLCQSGIFLFDDLATSPGMPRVIPEVPFKQKGPLGGLHFTGFGYAIKD